MALAIMLQYISNLHFRMQSSITQNIRLLDGMHEGLLIVSKAENAIMFCNKPAQKLFTGAISSIS